MMFHLKLQATVKPMSVRVAGDRHRRFQLMVHKIVLFDVVDHRTWKVIRNDLNVQDSGGKIRNEVVHGRVISVGHEESNGPHVVQQQGEHLEHVVAFEGFVASVFLSWLLPTHKDKRGEIEESSRQHQTEEPVVMLIANR